MNIQEQKSEVKSVGNRLKRVFNTLEETFLSERVRKREHEIQQHRQEEEELEQERFMTFEITRIH